MLKRLALFALLLIPCSALAGDPLALLAHEFWDWRAVAQPYSSDDIPRIERPGDGTLNWLPEAVRSRRDQLAGFEKRWRAIDSRGWPVALGDYGLIGSELLGDATMCPLCSRPGRLSTLPGHA